HDVRERATGLLFAELRQFLVCERDRVTGRGDVLSRRSIDPEDFAEIVDDFDGGRRRPQPFGKPLVHRNLGHGRLLRETVYTNPRGSAIEPARALAATVSGLARKTFASLCPIRPGKLRLVVLMQLIGVLSRPNVSDGPPRQAAQL